MNNNVAKLYTIAQKSKRNIIGLMSGTSLDGLDVALCEIENNGLDTTVKLLQFETIGYTADFKNEIKKIFAKKEIDFEQLCLLNPFIAIQHATIINSCLKKWNIKNEDIDLIASHGQTVYHAPKRLHTKEKFTNATLQIGDGDHIAVLTGIITISDFRQKHIAAGGEGAPLAVYGDYLIFGKQGENRILLNIGGIANFTFLPEDMNPQKIFSTDVGPGNTIMDAFIQNNYIGIQYDKDGNIASSGMINNDLLLALKADSFFKQSIPKTTGPELFNLNYLREAQIKSNTTAIANEDVLATLNKFSADAIAEALLKYTDATKKYKIFSSGGGMQNIVLMKHLKDALPQFEFYTTNDLEINPDAKEAVLFAILANECIAGDTSYLQKKIEGMPAVTMGKISFPT